MTPRFGLCKAGGPGRADDDGVRAAICVKRQGLVGKSPFLADLPGDARRVVLHQRDHIGYALGALRCELVLEVERREGLRDIHLRYFRSRPVLNRGDNQSDDPLGERGIAIGKEMEPALLRRGKRINPDVGSAAGHFGLSVLQSVGHGLKGFTEFDKQAPPIVSIQEFELFGNIGKLAHGAGL